MVLKLRPSYKFKMAYGVSRCCRLNEIDLYPRWLCPEQRVERMNVQNQNSYDIVLRKSHVHQNPIDARHWIKNSVLYDSADDQYLGYIMCF